MGKPKNSASVRFMRRSRPQRDRPINLPLLRRVPLTLLIAPARAYGPPPCGLSEQIIGTSRQDAPPRQRLAARLSVELEKVVPLLCANSRKPPCAQNTLGGPTRSRRNEQTDLTCPPFALCLATELRRTLAPLRLVKRGFLHASVVASLKHAATRCPARRLFTARSRTRDKSVPL
jgi:hypothetical protein